MIASVWGAPGKQEEQQLESESCVLPVSQGDGECGCGCSCCGLMLSQCHWAGWNPTGSIRSQSRIWLRCFSWNTKLNEKHLLRLLTRKSLNVVFQAMYHGLWLLQTLIVVQSADVRRELVICYCLCFPITKSGSCCHIFFFVERELQNIHQLFLHVGASRTDKKWLCQDWNRELLYT